MAKVKNACYLLTLHELRLVFTMNSYALSADAWAMAPATSVGRMVEIRPERAGVRAEGVVEAGHDYPADGLA